MLGDQSYERQELELKTFTTLGCEVVGVFNETVPGVNG
jgi:hypothetical protein